MLKLKRAHAHLDALYAKRNAFVNSEESQPYDLTGEVESETRTETSRRVTYLWRAQIDHPPDPEWALIVGDFAHNLRSALDHLVWQLVILSGKKPSGENQFPICTTGTRYWCARKDGSPSVRDRMLRGVDERYRAIIDRMQPYRGGHESAERSPLAVLSTLSNTDKHRLLQTAFVAPLTLSPEDFDVACDAEGGMAEIKLVSDRLEKGAPFMRVVYEVPDPDAKVQMKAKIPVAIMFGEVRVRDEALGLLYEFIRDFLKDAKSVFP